MEVQCGAVQAFTRLARLSADRMHRVSLSTKSLQLSLCCPTPAAGRVPVRVAGPVQAGDVFVPSGKQDGSAVVRSVCTGLCAALGIIAS